MPDQTPHPHVHTDQHPAHEAAPDSIASHAGRRELSIWFFCGILTLGYGVVLLVQSGLEQFGLLGQHPPATVLANLHPTFWWGFLLTIFGAFYTVRFRPGKG
jgi:hypothetical protein